MAGKRRTSLILVTFANNMVILSIPRPLAYSACVRKCVRAMRETDQTERDRSDRQSQIRHMKAIQTDRQRAHVYT